jgi:hypothetical protein
MDGVIPFRRERNMNRRSEHWQDTVNIILSIWHFISRWVLGYSGGQVQAWNAWIVGVVVFMRSLLPLRSSRDERSGLVEAMRRIDAEGTDGPQRRLPETN